MKRIFLILLSCLFFNSCIILTVFDNSYCQNEDLEPSLNLEYLNENENPKIIVSDDISADYDKYISQNYVAIGKAHFISKAIDKNELQDFAKKIKATTVLIQDEYKQTVTEQRGSVYDGSGYITTKLINIYEYKIYYLNKVISN